MIINTAQPIIKSANNTVNAVNKKIKRSLFRSKKRVIRYGLVTVNIIIILAVAGFVISVRNNQNGLSSPILALNDPNSEVSEPLDTLSSADIAVHIAQLARLDEVTAVANNADTINSQLEIISSDSQVVAKPQIVATQLRSVSDVQSYTSVEGDTVSSIAEKFGISKDSVKWSNSLSGDTVATATELRIPPVDGLIYTIKAGDTFAKIAEKYKSDEAKIIAFNDAEISGLVEGKQIVIPGGAVPVSVARSVPSYNGFRFGTSAIYGYNGYDYGYCTWYAANKRAEAGRPVPANLGNASTWKVIAQRAGFPVGNTPAAGAVIWTPPRDYYGHVGYVEEVFPDGSARISEMNTRGWGVRSEKVLTPEQAANYQYIY